MSSEEDYSLQPPQDLDAEQATLGAMLQSDRAINEVMGILTAEHFYRPAHAVIYDAILHLFGSGEPVDVMLLSEELSRRGKIRHIGGAPYLHTLMQACPMPASAPFYARSVIRKARMRHLVETGIRWQQLGYSETSTDEELDLVVAQAEDLLRGMNKPSEEGDMMGDLFKEWQVYEPSTDDIIPTPWVELTDYLGGGFRKGKLYVLAGRPGSGKSMGALNIALEMAEKNTGLISVFSLEMGKLEVAERILASGAYASYSEIFRRRMQRETSTRVAEYIDSNSDLPMEVIDRSGITVEQIIAHVRSKKPTAVIIDYCQLITASFRGDRREAIDHITRSLKVCANDTGCCIILCSQVNRNGADRMPTIQDLRESGSIENDADVVLLLHKEEGSGTVKLNVGKNRNGKLGTIEFVWRGDVMRIG